MDIARMVVKGRHPKDKSKFIIDKVCNFVIYVIKGSGKIYAGDEEFNVKKGDVVYVPNKNKYAADGDMEYVTVDVPAFYLEQYEEIEVK
jgi:mannose-6-phosphate isomerase-like protein (cupin superfamily)